MALNGLLMVIYGLLWPFYGEILIQLDFSRDHRSKLIWSCSIYFIKKAVISFFLTDQKVYQKFFNSDSDYSIASQLDTSLARNIHGI